MNTDNLIICPRCGSDACYTNEVNDKITNYSCFGCGFQSNSLMKEGEQFLEEQLSVLPELYIDLLFEDKNGQSWLPQTISLPKKGMVFVNGSSTKNWKWAAVLAVPVKEEEKEKYPIPGKKDEYYEHRMDMSTMKMFDEKDFIDALSYIEVLPS
jgi:Zn ribbon nucleic-acid-binding protein